MIYWSKICIFCCFNFLHTPVSTEALARRGHWDLGLESWSQKTTVPGLADGKNCTILWSLVSSQYQRVTDEWTKTFCL